MHTAIGIVEGALKVGLTSEFAPLAGYGERYRTVQSCQQVCHGIAAGVKGFMLHASQQKKIVAKKGVLIVADIKVTAVGRTLTAPCHALAAITSTCTVGRP